MKQFKSKQFKANGLKWNVMKFGQTSATRSKSILNCFGRFQLALIQIRVLSIAKCGSTVLFCFVAAFSSHNLRSRSKSIKTRKNDQQSCLRPKLKYSFLNCQNVKLDFYLVRRTIFSKLGFGLKIASFLYQFLFLFLNWFFKILWFCKPPKQ